MYLHGENIFQYCVDAMHPPNRAFRRYVMAQTKVRRDLGDKETIDRSGRLNIEVIEVSFD